MAWRGVRIHFFRASYAYIMRTSDTVVPKRLKDALTKAKSLQDGTFSTLIAHIRANFGILTASNRRRIETCICDTLFSNENELARMKPWEEEFSAAPINEENAKLIEMLARVRGYTEPFQGLSMEF